MVVVEPVSFSELGSASLATVVSLVYVVPEPAPGGTCPIKLKTLVLFAGRLAIEHVVVLPGEGQFHAGPEFCVKDTKVNGLPAGTPPGKESVKLALVAAFGPKFVTVIVKVRSVSGWTCEGLLLVKLRSALLEGV